MVEAGRKSLGAWYTPPALVDLVVDAVIDETWLRGRGPSIRVVDPACGDGRFLRAAIDRCRSAGLVHVDAIGVDVDLRAVESARAICPDAEIVHGDALGDVWSRGLGVEWFDVVVGNPPFLSQMAAATSRGGTSRHGGGPYADAAVEFLALGSRLVDPDGGRLGFVLPQSLLSARDAGDVRRSIDERAVMLWSSWTGQRDFDAQVVTCALAFEFGAADDRAVTGSWASVVSDRLGVPPVPDALGVTRSTLGDHGWLNANFRDEYYGLVAAVDDHPDGPPLVTSGVIDPGVCRWGERDIRFAKRTFVAPRVDLDALDAKMTAWAERRLRPKVLVANQTRVVEAVADASGAWLPGVPVVSIYPDPDATVGVWEIAAVLTSASASVWAWHERGGSGLSANTIRLGPVMLAELPWPVGDLSEAVDAVRSGDLRSCGAAVDRAHGIDPDEATALDAWWWPLVERAGRVRPSVTDGDAM